MRIAVIGCGRIGRLHATTVRALAPDGTFAFCDPDVAAAQRTAAECGGGRVYDDVDACLGAEPPDVVHVCTPPATHGALALRALAAGAAVLVEKPLALTVAETAAIASYSQANRFIHALKELGCRFALDDFGTGLSSFGYLKHFPVDFLKIDGSFVKEILHDPIDREMVRSINEIGHLTGKQTIAEFAENAEIITMLRGMGIDYAQGYGVSEPKRLLQAVA